MRILPEQVICPCIEKAGHNVPYKIECSICLGKMVVPIPASEFYEQERLITDRTMWFCSINELYNV